MNPNRQLSIAVATSAPRVLRPLYIAGPFGRVLRNIALLTVGTLLWVFALQGFMIPHQILSGGLLGIAMICGHFFAFVDVAWLNLLLNLPLFWLGWRYVGNAFTLYSLFGTFMFSILSDVVTVSMGTEIHPFWACMGAGLLGGGGSALILRSAGTAGGLDILVVYLRNRFRCRAGRLVLALNSTVLVAAGGLMGLEAMLYSLLFLTICSYTIDALIPRPAASPPDPSPAAHA